MDIENPYKPSSDSSLMRGALEQPESYPADRCPSCKANVTFWVTFRQGSPFRFRCLNCKASYQIETPFMRTILTAFVVTWVLALYGIGYAIEIFGTVILIPCASIALIVVLYLETWTYRYIKTNGKLHQGRPS